MDVENAKRILALKEFMGLRPVMTMGETDIMTGKAVPMEASRLYQLARSRDPAARAELGDSITDLFTSVDLSLREQEIVSDILISMLRQAEKDLRKAIAERLSVLPNAPLRVILHLSNDDIDVAQSILEQSAVLEDMDLMLIIEMKKSPYWQSIARRKGLNAPVTRALVETRDPETAVVLVRNETAQITPDSFTILAEMATVSNDLSAPLLNRSDLPKDLIAVVYAHAGQKIQKEMHDQNSSVLDNVADVTHEFVSAAHDDHTPTRLMIDAARILAARKQLSLETMIQSLKNGQIGSCIAQMMVLMDMDYKSVRALLMEEAGETLAAFCRVQRAEKKVFLKIFLLTQKYRSGDRLVDPMMLNKALMVFDQMNMDACLTRLQKIKTLN